MRSLSAKLIAGLVAGLAGVLFWLGSANLRVLRQNLEATTLLSEKRIAGIIFQSTRYSMLRNDREQLLQIVRSISVQPDVRRIRIMSKRGTIQVSTQADEVGRTLDQKAEACNICHSASQPLAKPDSKQTYRFFALNGERVIGLIRPIENEPACSNASCHAHPASQRILGVLDVVLSLAAVDQELAAHERRMTAQVLLSALLMMGMAGLLVWFLISRPIRRLIAGVKILGSRQLSYRFNFKRRDEIGELAGAFDNMATEVESLNQTLEARIQRKTKDLEAAQEKLIHSEKLASLGELSAAVAHEINNPLAGIFTYARLLEKKLAPGKPALEWIQTIERESKRCGEIVNNLLVFARRQHTEMAMAEVKTIVERTVAVVQHKLHMNGVALATEVAELPQIYCDASQIQQVLTAIIMNAVDALSGQGPKDGNIRIHAALSGEDRVDIAVANDGPPIPKEVLPHIFEPFFSTKQATSGVGLGLAVTYGIVKRHGGEIQVETGLETIFHVILPVGEQPGEPKKLETTDVGREAVDPDRR